MAEFDKLKDATGFDPRTDMTEMVAGATGTNGGLIAGHGAFQPARVASLATAAGAPTENYRGITLIGGGTAGEQDTALAFLDGTTVLLGNRVAVRAAVDRWISATRSSSALSTKAANVSATSQAWAVATGLSELQGPTAPDAPPEAQMVQNVLAKITQVSGGLNFGETITMHAQALTASAQDAQALADVFQFVLSMAGGETPLPATPLVSTNGSTLDIRFTLTEQQAEELFRPALTPRTALLAVAH
jgi:hypothetical protein